MEPDNDNDTAAVLDADAENAVLRAALAQGATPPADPVELAAWAREHVAQRLDGGVTILPSGLPEDGLSGSQRAVLQGNPNLPLGLHRQVMTQAPRSAVDQLAENLNLIHDPEVRRECWREFHDKAHNPTESDGLSALSHGLRYQARTQHSFYGGQQYQDIKGDIFS